MINWSFSGIVFSCTEKNNITILHIPPLLTTLPNHKRHLKTFCKLPQKKLIPCTPQKKLIDRVLMFRK